MNITNMENNGITMPENKEQSFSTENKGSENLHGNEKNNIQNTDISEISEGSANILQNEKDLTANIPAERAQNITDESYIEITKSAENSDDDEPLDPEDFEIVDYTSFSKEQLNTELKKLLAEKPIQDIKISADLIKTNFYKKLKLDTEKKRKAFIDAGGELHDFIIELDPLETEFRELLRKYRDDKAKFTEEIEKEKQENLKIKYEIIEKIKELSTRNESINQTFHDFRELQKQWREVGLIPQTEVKKLWDTYNYEVEKFYDFVKINLELRDLDLKKNLDTKIILCEKAEELLLEPSIRKAFITLQKLHDEWRETGPVPKEKKEEIWERFKETTTKINKKYQEYYIELKEEQKNNLAVKVHICEKIEEIAHQEINMIKDWQKKTLEIQELQKMWRTIGFAPKKYNTIIYERYKQSCDDFFNRKKEYFLQLQDEQQNNMQLKTDICMQAEALKDSTDWKKTTEDFINLQNKWKKIGHVQKKKSEALWTRFRTACNFFFERKAQFYSSIDSFLESNLKAKTGLIEKIEHFEPGDDNKQNLEMLKNFQKEWTDIGLVPVNKRYKLQEQFRDTINAKFDSLKLGAYEKSMIHFKSWIDEILKSPNSKEKLKFEKEKIVQKLKWLENDIVIWENNIGFFTNSKSAEALIKDVQNKIDSGKESVRILKAKLDIINKL